MQQRKTGGNPWMTIRPDGRYYAVHYEGPRTFQIIACYVANQIRRLTKSSWLPTPQTDNKIPHRITSGILLYGKPYLCPTGRDDFVIGRSQYCTNLKAVVPSADFFAYVSGSAAMKLRIAPPRLCRGSAISPHQTPNPATEMV